MKTDCQSKTPYRKPSLVKREKIGSISQGGAVIVTTGVMAKPV